MNRSELVLLIAAIAAGASLHGSEVVQTDRGKVEGTVNADASIRTYRGIPYAAPPVAALRWKAPQPSPKWNGVKSAREFGSRCMQDHIFQDMLFRDKEPSEDCLYLNVWTPAKSQNAKLPLMVWIYGGGFTAGASSEPRQDGENLAKKGVVVVSMNYRLGIFGFLAHPALSLESGHHASGNYGFMDQVAALEWVKRNINAFGGDPAQVTIFGESAGSFSVSALMASPLARGLFQRANGESGAFFGPALNLQALGQREEAGKKFAEGLGANSITELRALPADTIMHPKSAGTPTRLPGDVTSPNTDGYFLTEEVKATFAAGKQSHVPLLAGWNADDMNFRAFFAREPASAQTFVARMKGIFGDDTDAALKLYPGETDGQAKQSAQELAGDQFIAYSTWKWIEAQTDLGDVPVFRYRFEDAPPFAPGAAPAKAGDPPRGAYHSAEIEYVFGTLASKDLPWRPEETKLSELMSTYWTNFAKTGNPNGPGLPEWPAYNAQHRYVMHLKEPAESSIDQRHSRYELLDRIYSRK
jgi:para-nitrobenzyl esterase